MARCHRSLSHPYDPDLSRMLKVFIATGIAFMILPGTFVGVMNLLKISATHTSGAADAGWIQAHGHAQIFGWLGTFILGIGFYTIPRLRLSPFHQCTAWITYALWVTGVTMRWAVGTWPPENWRLLFPLASTLVSQILAYEGISQFAWKTLPLSAIIEMTAVTLFAFNMLMTFTVDSPLELLEKQGESPVNEAKPGLRAVS